MPRERQELVRASRFRDAEKLFILSFEGTETEPRYFEGLRSSACFNDCGLLEIVSRVRPKADRKGSNPINVKRLLKVAKTDYDFRKTDEFWLIVDRDDWAEQHHIDFGQLVAECKAEGNFFMAMSNPCFDFWLLLHLRDFTNLPEDIKSQIYQNKRISNKKHFIDTVIEEAINDGRGYSKRIKAEIFLPGIYDAIARAKELNNPDEDYPSSFGSDVFKLVEKLVK